jgi:uncharacterized membrane protein
MSAPVFWPAALGLCVLAVGLWTHRRALFDSALPVESTMRALGPVFIGAAIATFSGEHFTDAADLVRLVPRWLPLRIPITYLVGVALLAAGLSLAARVAVRWSAPLLALLFGLFVLLIHLPNAVEHARTRIFWIFPFREGTFAVGAFSIFVSETKPSWARRVGGFSLFARLWTAFVLVFFGVQHLGYPQFAPGVPSPRPTSSWVPLPHVISHATGAILVILGAAALFKKTAVAAITWAGILMAVLTVLLYVPDLLLAHGPGQPITAINFVADTLLFSGSVLAIACAVLETTLSGNSEAIAKTSLSRLEERSSDVAPSHSIV